MPKMKTHSAAAKRVRKTGRGKLVRRQANISHLKEGKTSTRKRRLKRSSQISKADTSRVRRMLGG